MLKGSTLVGGPRSEVGSASKHVENLKGGNHTISLSVTGSTLGVALRVDFYPTGSKKPAPIVERFRKPRPAGVPAADDYDDGELDLGALSALSAASALRSDASPAERFNAGDFESEFE